jgi:ABC-type branched-subunit amino acid transport system ATPase component
MDPVASSVIGSVPRDQNAAGQPSALLSVRDVHQQFGGVSACSGVSFDVRAGTITALIGPNGAGKSTMISIIAGALRPTSGSVFFEGRNVTGQLPHELARLGLTRTFQTSSEFGRLTVLENLLVAAPSQLGETFLGALRGRRYWLVQERARVGQARELLGRFNMRDKESEFAGDLSGGQKRLVEIMRALMAKPKFLLLDEPMVGVHPDLALRLAEHLERLRDEGVTMLMVEHEMSIVERLCDPVIVMAQGAVLVETPMRQLRQHQAVVDAYLAG